MQDLPLTKRTLLFIVMVGTLLGAGVAGAFTFNGSPASAQTTDNTAVCEIEKKVDANLQQ